MPSLAVVTFLVGSALGGATALAEDASACPMHAAHQAASQAGAKGHHDQVDQRHDDATGVAHADAVHHFDIGPRGGTIRLEVTDATNTSGRDRIRTHLAKIAGDFGEGRFDLPTSIHGQVPPGADAMRRLRAAIRYRFTPMPLGGRVEITTRDGEARAAIHEFLRFQIDEHRTGDRR
jgi:hypothetical protein